MTVLPPAPPKSAAYGVDGDHTEKHVREELVIGRLEAPLLCVLRDNPMLVHYLLDTGGPA